LFTKQHPSICKKSRRRTPLPRSPFELFEWPHYYNRKEVAQVLAKSLARLLFCPPKSAIFDQKSNICRNFVKKLTCRKTTKCSVLPLTKPQNMV
jgi:hypothetical protein